MTTCTSTTPAAPRRRSFLGALSAFVAAPAAVAVPAIAATAPAPTELPELIEIGQKLTALFDEYRAAVAKKIEARETYEQTRPALPDDLIHRGRDSAGLVREETDINGATVWPDGAEAPRWIYSAKDLQIHIIRHDTSRHTKEGRRLRRLAKIAKNYEAGTKAAHIASGYDDCLGDAASVAGEINIAAAKLLKLEPITLRGVLIVARAAMGVGGVLELGSARVVLVAALGEHVAESLIRLERGAQ